MKDFWERNHFTIYAILYVILGIYRIYQDNLKLAFICMSIAFLVYLIGQIKSILK